VVAVKKQSVEKNGKSKLRHDHNTEELMSGLRKIPSIRNIGAIAMNTPSKEAIAEKAAKRIAVEVYDDDAPDAAAEEILPIIQSAIEELRKLKELRKNGSVWIDLLKSRAAQPQSSKLKLNSVTLARSLEEQAEIEAGVHLEPYLGEQPQKWTPEYVRSLIGYDIDDLAANKVSDAHNAALEQLK
jgi:hypothetical protein